MAAPAGTLAMLFTDIEGSTSLARSQAEDLGARATEMGGHTLGDSWIRQAAERLGPEGVAAAEVRGRAVAPGQRVARACALAGAAIIV